MSPSHAVGLDLGGTRLKAIALSPLGEELAREVAPTGGADWQAQVRASLSKLKARLGEPTATAVAAPGIAASDRRSIAFLPGRLPGIEGLDWTAWLGSSRTVPVMNDAHASLLAEVARGAARGARNVVLLTLGTGVGGAIMADGRILRGAIGRAGHLGHISLDLDGDPSIAGTPGAIEVLFGNATVARRTGGRFPTTTKLVDAYQRGDPDATRAWLRSVRALGCALTSLINIVDPEVIVLAGGIARAGDGLLVPLRAELDRIEWRPGGHSVPIRCAALGDWAGAMGAAHAALESAAPSAAPRDQAAPIPDRPLYAMQDSPTPTPAQVYLARARGLVDCVEQQLPLIRQAAGWFAETILSGRMVHVFGSGHSRIMAEEMWPRYGSFPGFHPMVELSLTFHNSVVGANGQRQAMYLENVSGLAERILRNFALDPRDSALVISSSGCNAVPIEVAELFRQRGVKVVALVSRAHGEASASRRADGKKLPDMADLVLDNGAPAGDAMVKIEGLDTPVAPGSTVGGCLVVNAIKAEVAKLLTAAGHPPKVLGAAVIVGAERAAQVFEAAYDEHARRLARLYEHPEPK